MGIISKWKHFSFRIRSRKSIFTEIYDRGGFGGKDVPPSGIGSSLEQTERIRQALSSIIEKFAITSLVDAPCGDFTWMQKVNLGQLRYRGFDIVRSVVEKNRLLYGRANVEFGELDIVESVAPIADLFLCRDCLVHLSNKDALKAITNIKESGCRYLLTTTFSNLVRNRDMVSGRGWRAVNLQKPPFDFPEPITLVVEGCTEENEKYRDKCLGLWSVKELP